MLKGEDIVVALALVGVGSGWTVRSLADSTGIPRSGVQRALVRLGKAGLLDERRRRVRALQLEEFVVHGVRYLFPPVLGGETRGVATAWAAEPLVGRVGSVVGSLPLVWPDPLGVVRGIELVPLHWAAVEGARRSPPLGELLVLVDGLRVGDARLRGIAAELLSDRLAAVAA
jgi:hypothetical protein